MQRVGDYRGASRLLPKMKKGTDMLSQGRGSLSRCSCSAILQRALYQVARRFCVPSCRSILVRIAFARLCAAHKRPGSFQRLKLPGAVNSSLIRSNHFFNRQQVRNLNPLSRRSSRMAQGGNRRGSPHADIRLANPHVAEHAAARAVHALTPEMTYAQAFHLADKATNWAAQAHHKWFWRGIPGRVY
jgi:hypothetical protein